MSDPVQNVSQLQQKLKDINTQKENVEPPKLRYTDDYQASAEDFFRGGCQDGYDKMQELLKKYPDAANDPKVKTLKKRLEIVLNIS